MGFRGCVVVAVASLLALTGCATYQAARLYARGSAALERGEQDRAIVDLERAAALAPQASEIHNHLGLAYQAVGRDEEALRAFRRATELDCENLAAAENLRAAELLTGRSDP